MRSPFLAGVALALVACSGDLMVAPTTPIPEQVSVAIPCLASVTARTIACSAPQTAAGQEILGGQGIRVVLRSSHVAYDAGLEHFTFTTTVQNLVSQTIGWDGASVTGVRVLFVSAPAATSGSGAITILNDSVGTVTATNQDYYLYPQLLSHLEISDTVGWAFGVPATVNTFAFTVLVAAEVEDQGGPLRWDRIQGFNDDPITAVAPGGFHEAMAVGIGGSSFHFDGGGFTLIPPMTAANFYSVASIGGGKYIATASDHSIYTFDGKIWSLTYTYPTTDALTAIYVRDPQYWVAVGGNTVVADSAGSLTTAIFIGQNLKAVSALDTGGADVVGLDGRRYHDQGGSWLFNGALSFGNVGSLGGYQKLTDTSFVWSWYDYTTDSGYVITIDGGTVDTLIRAKSVAFPAMVQVTPDSLLLAVTNTPSGVGTTDLWSLRLHDAQAALLSSFPRNGVLSALARDTAGDVWGMSDSLGPMEFLSGSWATYENGLTGNFRRIWGHGNSVWFLGANGLVWRDVNGILNPDAFLSGSGDLTGLWGVSANEIYALDSASGIWRRDGTGTWSPEADPAATSPLLAIWGDSTTGDLITAGMSGKVTVRTAGSWTALTSPTSARLEAVWGCSPTQAWIVGEGGTVLRRGHDSLTVQSLGISDALHAVSGTSCSDVWVSGSNGTLYHWDGSGWGNFSVGGFLSFAALYARAPGEVYVGTTGGPVLFTTTGTTIQYPTPAFGLIEGIWRQDNGTLWAVGQGSVVTGTR